MSAARETAGEEGRACGGARGHAGEADAAAARGGAPSRAGVMLRADSRGRRAHKGWRSRAREVQRRLRRDEPALVSHTELGECNEACRCTTKQKLALRASRELVTAVRYKLKFQISCVVGEELKVRA